MQVEMCRPSHPWVMNICLILSTSADSVKGAQLPSCPQRAVRRPHCHTAPCAGETGPGASELRSFIGEMAEKALLGLGGADLVYPTTLDQM